MQTKVCEWVGFKLDDEKSVRNVTISLIARTDYHNIIMRKVF